MHQKLSPVAVIIGGSLVGACIAVFGVYAVLMYGPDSLVAW